MKIISYILIFAVLGFSIYFIITSVIDIVKKIKDRKNKKL